MNPASENWIKLNGSGRAGNWNIWEEACGLDGD
jgi:hypothetical protein